MREFLRIVFTSPKREADETERCVELLRTGAVHMLHLRKPLWTVEDTYIFLKSFPEDLLTRVRLHDYFHLLEEFPLGGVQLNSRNQKPPIGVTTSFSKSCHTLEEIQQSDGSDYVTLSPIFDSISKEGYKAQTMFDEETLRHLLTHKNIVALGGVDPTKFTLLRTLGFFGGAMLGYIWNNPVGKSFSEIVDTLKSFN